MKLKYPHNAHDTGMWFLAWEAWHNASGLKRDRKFAWEAGIQSYELAVFCMALDAVY